VKQNEEWAVQQSGGLIQKIFAKSGEMWYSGKNTHWRIFGWKEKS
jgi:hypothetical protein